jgi:hypothetical protein
VDDGRNWDKPHYTNVQMPFEGVPPEVPELNPTGIYEREFEVPAEWAGRRVVLHVGAAESVLLVSLNGDEFGVGKDSHLASEFDLTDRLRPGANRLTLRVVKWSDATYVEDQDQWWHGGISVFLYATRVSTWPMSGRCRSRRRPDDRHADLGVTLVPARKPARVERARLDGIQTRQDEAVPVDGRRCGWTLDDSGSCTGPPPDSPRRGGTGWDVSVGWRRPRRP